jgi:ABC-2 type transport system permease protein
MNLAIYTTALSDFIRPARMIGWVAAVAVTFFIGMFWNNLFVRDMSPLQAYGQLSQIIVYRIVALASAIFSMAVLAQEVEQKTVVYLLTRSQPRWAILLGRTLASMTCVIVIGWAAIVAGCLAVVGPRGLTSPEVLTDFLVVAAGALAFGALFVFFSLLMNRAMILSLLWAFGWETFAQNLPGMRPLSVLSYLSSIAMHEEQRAQGIMTFFAGDMTLTKTPALLSWAVLAGASAGLMLLSMWWFTHFEYTPREDAE